MGYQTAGAVGSTCTFTISSPPATAVLYRWRVTAPASSSYEQDAIIETTDPELAVVCDVAGPWAIGVTFWDNGVRELSDEGSASIMVRPAAESQLIDGASWS